MAFGSYKRLLIAKIIFALSLYGYIFPEKVLAEPISFPKAYETIDGIALDSQSQPQEVLILASLGPTDGEYYSESLYRLHRFQQILQSHWSVYVEVTDVSEVIPEYLDDYEVIIVVEEYENDNHSNVLNLLKGTDATVVWAGYGTGDFLLQAVGGTPKIESVPIADQGKISYKDISFTYSINNIVDLVDFTQVEGLQTYATIETDTGRYPWLVGFEDHFFGLPIQIPYSFAVDNYSLVVLDFFHMILGHHEPQKQAILRLEDVDPHTYKSGRELKRVYGVLRDRSVPFQVSLIGRYINPMSQIDLTIIDKYRYLMMLQKMMGEGLGVLVQHGYTHQYGNSVSGMGFEFWDDINEQPIAEDSEQYVKDRIAGVQRLMQSVELPMPDIWETPHYSLSELDNITVNRYYPLRYGDLQEGGSLPFVVAIDEILYIPENLGYVYSVEDIKLIEDRLMHLSAFEDPVASFFWHPWRDVSELSYLLDHFEMRGYTFVSAYDLINHTGMYASGTGFLSHKAFLDRYIQIRKGFLADTWIALCFIIFTVGVVLYLYNRWRIRRYVKTLCKTRRLDDLYAISAEARRGLPAMAILVPARNEALVIENTILRLSKLDYPKDLYKILIILDAREHEEHDSVKTLDVVKRVARKLNRIYGAGFVSYFEVPVWYSGIFKSRSKTYAKSTKGRALNYALGRLIHLRQWRLVEILGVVDADGRLDTNVLKEVAEKYILTGKELFQGPVFQVSNYAKVGINGIAAGLELAIHHLTDLPHRLLQKRKSPQFLAGTNYFISRDLLVELEGLNHTALVEDAELALRIYIHRGEIAEWLSWPEIEQSPETIGIYFRQRERWAIGHLELINHIRLSPLSFSEKFVFIGLVYFNMLRFIFDLGVPFVGGLLFFGGYLFDIGAGYRELSFVLMIASIFIWDYYGSIYRLLFRMGYIQTHEERADTRLDVLLKSIVLIVYMPIFIFIQAAPRFAAAIKYVTRSYSGAWYKTRRTAEKIFE